MKSITVLLAAVVCLQASGLNAQEKVVLQPTQQELLQKLKADPPGVVVMPPNEDGSFKSLVIKATVPIEDSLSAVKGKQLAAKEAEMQCKSYLSQFLKENCVFKEDKNGNLTIETKGESAKDAAGNTVKLRSQHSQESKSFSDSYTSTSEAALKGLIVVSSEVSNGQDGQEFTLIMALTQKSLIQATAVAKALSGSTPNPGTSGSETDRSNPEIKVNSDALDDLR